MPEHSLLRSRIPDAALDSLKLPLGRQFNTGTPALIDLRDSIPDSGFTDISHMNQDGRDAFSSGFARIIAEQLPGTN
jgi:hypothetical protein